METTAEQGNADSEAIPKTVEQKTPVKAGEQENPFGDGFNVLVSVPETLQIKMVNASSLEAYEHWLFISSLLGSGAIAFWEAVIQNTTAGINGILWGISLLITALFLLCGYRAFKLRKQLTDKSKNLTYKMQRKVAEDPKK
jgi:hypothetical protein